MLPLEDGRAVVLACLLGKNSLHHLAIEKVAVDTVSQVVHQSSEHNTFLLALSKGNLFPLSLALLSEDIHL